MSILPNIKIGVDTHKGKFNLSAMTHTTSEIGYVHPTYSKMLVPKSKLSVRTRTGSRLSPLFVPTMGQIDIRHYHCFIPLSTLWTPFDAFLTKTNYTLPDGSTYIPTRCPYFTFFSLWTMLVGVNSPYVMQGTSISYPLRIYKYLTAVITDYQGDILSDTDVEQYCAVSLYGNLVNRSVGGVVSAPGFIKTREGNIWSVEYRYDSSDAAYPYKGIATRVYTDDALDVDTDLSLSPSDMSFPSFEAHDFSVRLVDDGLFQGNIYYNFNGPLKRLRSIFMGLGYSFNPYDDEQVTPFKLLAFYKSYWSLFGVNRTYNFFNTFCYKTIKRLSDTTSISIMTATGVSEFFVKFVAQELTVCTYTTPADYFSASDTTTQRASQNVGNVGFNFQSEQINNYASSPVGASSVNGQPVYANANGVVGTTPASNPLSQLIAKRLLRFINKNSVVGRKVSDILRTRYGVSDSHNYEHEGILKIGASATPIDISAVYNNTDSGDMPLGSYAGLGVTGKIGAVSKKFYCDTKEFGIFMTLTAVVPKMGYFQGMFRENSDGVKDSMEFYTPEFDAVGWQSVRYNELIADRQFAGNGLTRDNYQGKIGTALGVFGFMPTYSHLKVQFNRALGDISLPHMQDSMLPYTLDRFFPQRTKHYDADGVGYDTLPLLPANDPNWFRSATRGNTNRIFSDVSPTDDHVIMQIFFDVSMSAPMKPLSTSFDTFDEESTHSVDVEHE